MEIARDVSRGLVTKYRAFLYIVETRLEVSESPTPWLTQQSLEFEKAKMMMTNMQPPTSSPPG